jgi:outer membrane protein assembly factor BamC
VNHNVKLSLVALVALAVLLSACSSMDSDNKADYKGATKSTSLVVPPDLTQLSRDSRYTVAGGAVSASSFQSGQQATAGTPAPTAISSIGDVRVERAGDQRWLVVNRPADQLWGPVSDFWRENGFTLITEQANLGIMETDWAENRAKLPADFIRNTIGKIFDSLYSTGERDRYRTRLERNAAGGTDIFITHRGMMEVYASAQKDQTTWQPRPSDPELETEFMLRLMVRLGAPREQAKAVVAAAGPAGAATVLKPLATIATVNGQQVVQVTEGFDRAWRRVGLALDRTGFTVEDRDRSQGTYFVRYVEPSSARAEQGFFSKLFGADNGGTPTKYRVLVRSQGDATTISVLNDKGQPDNSANAQRMVKVIADELK